MKASSTLLRRLFVGGILLGFVLLGHSPLWSAQLLPGVYGYGLDRATNSAGFGPNAVIVHVTSLANDGPETLREAVSKPIAGNPPRIVVFDTSGVITLESPVSFDHPNVTIAGQTAPSPGIAIHGSTLLVRSDNVLVQHLRVRPGDRWSNHLKVNSTTNRDAVSVGRSPGKVVSNVVFDHCSFTWGLDELADAYGAYDNVTFNRCLFAEPLAISIHIDEGTFDVNLDDDPERKENYAWQAEDLAQTTSGIAGVGLATHSLAVARRPTEPHQYQTIAARAPGDYVDYVLPIVPAPKRRRSNHIVIVGLTGPDRATFRAEVRNGDDDSLLQTSKEFDQYATNTTHESYVARDVEAFTIPPGLTSLKVRLVITGKAPESSGYTLAVDQLSISQGHAFGPLFSSGREGGGKLAIVGSILASLTARAPWAASKQLLVANNVMYNRVQQFVMLGHSSFADPKRDRMDAAIVGNTFIEGPSWPDWAHRNSPVEKTTVVPGSRIYAALNDHDAGQATKPPIVEVEPTSVDWTEGNPIAQVDGMAGFALVPAAEVRAETLALAGARPAERDVVDSRIVSEVRDALTKSDRTQRLGSIKHTVAQAGGWPTYPVNTARWIAPENPNASSDNGYTNIEIRLHELAAQVEGRR